MSEAAAVKPELVNAISEDVSIFDIPLIVTLIYCHLEKEDILKCTLVNRMFYTQSKRFLWSDISFMRRAKDGADGVANDKADTGFTSDRQAELISNAHWIQSFECGGVATPALTLAIFGTSCVNLKTLKMNITYHQSSLTAAVVGLMDRNPRLDNLTLSIKNDTPNGIDGFFDVLNGLSRHPYLKGVNFNEWRAIQDMDLPWILVHLPKTLQTLVYNPIWASDLRNLRRPQDTDWPQVFPCLSEFRSVEMSPSHSMTATLLPLVRRSPVLKAIAWTHNECLSDIAKALHDNCPKLEAMTIINSEVLDSELETLVEWSPSIKEFTLNGLSIMSTGGAFQRMAERWGKTLTTINLDEDVVLISSDIQRIMTSCPNLTHFHMEIDLTWEGTELASTGLKLSDAIDSPWVCLGIRSLAIMFMDERVEQSNARQHAQQERRTREWIRKAYAQLGALTQLESLTIGWQQPFRVRDDDDDDDDEDDEDDMGVHRRSAPVVQLDISLASGLDLLENLKKLEELDVRRLKVLAIQVEEMDWMVYNWPKLRALYGLDASCKQLVRDEDLPLDI
ncbi:hypothetical protein BG011_001745 [Mortierella polycephala]|uniref:Uncharacterized protein n=1 Tax=Mortierella polycephala TaxID=41804 RepID=A0A9P6U5V4_9FUNG|nr:hypothetical protein BG011_001745 [Mortierella polycephala]